MSVLSSLIGEKVELNITGRPQPEIGTLIDASDDIVVYTNRSRYFYVPLKHLLSIKRAIYEPLSRELQAENPIDPISGEAISYRKILMNARGLFVEISISGNHTLSGYMTSIMNDYLVFYSSVFHTVYVSLDHLKSIVPYPTEMTPYSTDKERMAVKPASLTLARAFEQQLKKMEGRMVVLDLGDSTDKAGLLQSVDRGILTLITAEGNPVVWNVSHIKSAHNP